MACRHPDSLLAIYRSLLPVCAKQPYVPFLHHALVRYDAINPADKLSVIAHAPETVVIMYDPHATHFSDEYLKVVKMLVHMFRIVVLQAESNQGDDERLDELKILATNNSFYVRKAGSWDDDMVFLWHASTILVHRGMRSALAALVCLGDVYTTDELSTWTSSNEYKHRIVRHKRPFGKFWEQEQRFNVVGGMQASCCHFSPFGSGDEEKMLCLNAIPPKQKCWVLSIGSNGKFEFEKDIVKHTHCDVHIYDCTGTWKLPREIEGRGSISKICVGKKGESAHGMLFESMEKLIERSSKRSGFEESTAPSVLKMDVEGYEVGVLTEMMGMGRQLLPDQMAVELHVRTGRQVGEPYVSDGEKFRLSNESLMEIVGKVGTMGYALVHRSDNERCAFCSEVTWVRNDLKF